MHHQHLAKSLSETDKNLLANLLISMLAFFIMSCVAIYVFSNASVSF